MAAFLAILFIYSEFNTTIAGESAMVLFKRGTKAPILDQDKKDEEESSGRSSRDTIEDASAAAAEAEKAMAEHPPMTDLSVGNICNIRFRWLRDSGVYLMMFLDMLLPES